MDDAADKVIEQWAETRPQLDAFPVGVVVRVVRASKLLEQGMKGYFDTKDLEPWEYDVLATLFRVGDKGTLRMSDLACAVMVTPSALTNRIDRLVAKGLVTRTADTKSRRTVRTTLTEEGRRLAEELIDGHAANARNLIDGLNDDEQELLTSLLRKLLLSLGDGIKN
ncbi:MarR family winged helix-turn-helix transcriptional regulator [Amycolatopsis sp. lyj-112]|uniref:MarR family winged helix-turn-helix transcriptional regulator n=1 Tax=Amycolatopsis sp. lyj-112 TaxID=2789288 RepID=UPI00397C70C5